MSEGKQRYNLTLQEQKAIIKAYEKALEDLANKTGKMLDYLMDRAAKENYKVINDLTIKSYNFYAVTLKGIMESNYNAWIQSENCMHKIIKKMGAGDSAEQTAKSLEGQLNAKIQGMIKQKKEFKPKEDQPNIEPAVLTEIEQKVAKYVSDITSSGKAHIGKIVKGNDSNMLFACIKGHVEATYEGAIAGYTDCVKKVNGISASLNQSMSKISSEVDSMNQQMVNKSVGAANNQDNFPQPPFM